MPIVRKTLSFVKGKGSLSHNNRTFVADNVDPKRIDWNITYVKETLEEAYEKCFGEAIREYNAGQKRKDRQKHDYINEIKNSRNNEKVFYENVVMIGCKKDTGVADENGYLTHEAAEAAKILDHYVKTFQERNPNLYLFNAVLHMDEATPHLHLDYIPVASGCYKKGLKIRNSLSKALQCMGFEKGKGKYTNETTAWQERERAYITELCLERGIEIVTLDEKRANLSLPEYKEVVKEIEELQEQAGELREEAQALKSENALLTEENTELKTDAENLSKENDKLTKKKNQLNKEIKKSAMTKRDFEQDVWEYRNAKKWQLPEPGIIMSAKAYRDKMADPLVGKLKTVIETLTLKCQNLLYEVERLTGLLHKRDDEIDRLEGRISYFRDENKRLQVIEHDMDLLKLKYGGRAVDTEVSKLRYEEQMEKQMKKQLRQKSRKKDRDAR